MKRVLVLTLGLLALGLAGLRPSTTVAAQGPWTTLFDAKNGLKGWDVVGDANWAVVDGNLQASTTVGSDGTYRFVVDPIALGAHEAYVTIADSAGNVSAPSAPVDITVVGATPTASGFVLSPTDVSPDSDGVQLCDFIDNTFADGCVYFDVHPHFIDDGRAASVSVRYDHPRRKPKYKQ